MTSENLLNCLKNNPTTYRSKLTIPSNINFGLEIELENVSLKTAQRVLGNYSKKWQVKEDQSLAKYNNAELVSPVLRNEKNTWIMLKNIAEAFQKLNPVLERSSFQINFDGSLLPTDAEKVKFLKLFAMYEDIIYRFSKGEDTEFRTSLTTYAYPIILEMKTFLKDEEYMIAKYTDQKRSGICFKEQKDLIEFRTPNSTLNPILWQNYITLFYYLIEYSKSNKCSLNELNTYIERYGKTYLLENYELEKKEKALKLVNNIYTNIDDQTYFMDQYLGF